MEKLMMVLTKNPSVTYTKSVAGIQSKRQNVVHVEIVALVTNSTTFIFFVNRIFPVFIFFGITVITGVTKPIKPSWFIFISTSVSFIAICSSTQYQCSNKN